MINKFASLLAARLNEYKKEMGYTYFERFDTVVEMGKRYAKVFAVEIHDTEPSRNNRRIVAFVDIATGDIFKPASFKAPAKHARGNVNSSLGGMEAIGPTGHVIYLR